MVKVVDKETVFLSAPLKPASEKKEGDQLGNLRDIFFLSVVPSGSPNPYNLQPSFGAEKTFVFDLACVSHRGLYIFYSVERFF